MTSSVLKQRLALRHVCTLGVLGFVLVLWCSGGAWGVEGKRTIDQIVEQTAQRDQVRLTESIADAQYLRRVSLDLIGRIPTVEEQTLFLAAPDRRALVESLIRNPEHALFWSRLWTDVLIGYGQFRGVDRESLRQWLQDRIADEQPWTQTVNELISASGRGAFCGPANFMLRHIGDPVVPVARLFLGIQLDCARCHDHPNDRWSEDDFESMQRFFVATRSSEPVPGTYVINDSRPPADARRPRFLTGSRPQTTHWREELGLFVTSSRPFARTLAGRLWYHFFGHLPGGAPDNINAKGSHDHDDLVAHLAQRLREDAFCWNGCIRELCLSRAYSRQVSTEDPQWPLMPTLKPLTADQLFESTIVALSDQAPMRLSRGDFVGQYVSASRDQAIGDPWQLREPLQSLMSRLSAEYPTVDGSIDEIYRRLLCREPTEAERLLAKRHANEDLSFALLFGNEFSFWH